MESIEPVSREKSLDPLLDLTSWIKAVNATRPTFALSSSAIPEIEHISDWPDSYTAGRALADKCVDAGARLVFIDGGNGHSSHRALIALLTAKDAAKVLRTYIPGSDDLSSWQMETRDISTSIWQHRDALTDLQSAPAALGCDDVSGLAGLLIGLASRKTPAVIHDVAAHAAALLAQRIAHRSTSWFAAACMEEDAAIRAAQERLGIPRIINGTLAPEMQRSALSLANAHVLALSAIQD
jgi:nicotinate-nucleotide--dimethylbenzimidazole phosphoribosyltransferase